MGRYRVRVSFPSSKDMPDSEVLRSKVSERSGLNVELYSLGIANDTEWYSLSHRDFWDPVQFHSDNSNVMCLELESTRLSYLDWIAIAALVDLGGQYKGKLPWFVDLKWRERKWWHFLPK